jgi:hypothetical protein
MANYDYGKDKVAGTGVSWQGVALYAKYQATDYWAIVPRYEWLDDDDAFMTGTRQKVQEFTLTSEFLIAKSLITRLEYRRDFSNSAFFPTESEGPRKSQSTLTVGVIYAFGGKI